MKTRTVLPRHTLVALAALAPLALSALVPAAALEPPSADELAAILPAIVELRHAIHAHPELGYEEVETARRVAEHLRALGLEVRTGVAKTGVVAKLVGGRPGPVVAVRADMDALPVIEATDLPFRSTRRARWLGAEVGVAHACGHDVHTASALGLASWLAPRRAELAGTVVFLFQPDEEGPPPGEVTGALAMLRAGALDDPRPEAIVALHSLPELPVGRVALTPGPIFAAVDHFVVALRGQQSHGAYPHQGVDPVVMAAQAILALQTIRSRTLPPLEPSVVTVGIVRGGERFNIIPGEVRLEGTVRTFSPATRATVERRMREILDGVARAAGGTFELDYRQNAPVTVNDRALDDRLRPALVRALGAEAVVDEPPTMGGEDFAYFAEKVPGFYFRLGTTAPGKRSGGLHTPEFRADDGAIAFGIRALAAAVLGALDAPR